MATLLTGVVAMTLAIATGDLASAQMRAAGAGTAPRWSPTAIAGYLGWAWFTLAFVMGWRQRWSGVAVARACSAGFVAFIAAIAAARWFDPIHTGWEAMP
jgi:hypothetical protein